MTNTHHCAQLTAADLGATVSLVGWVDSIRDHGGILFIDLRDRKGVTQVKFDPQDHPELAGQAATVKPESVIAVTGVVVARPEGTVNKNLPTGAIEVAATALVIHNISETPPFPLTDAGGDKVNEDLRLTYRYLDLRRPKMRHNLHVRHKATKAIRDYFDSQEFIEVETPALFKSTPEGAREYLVPSRIHAGQFYALSQSPQQFKQILMVAGVERYFQIARCFRDEDLRADRQMEFTQVDVEASFIDREDVYRIFEGMVQKVWKTVLNVDIPAPFLRMPFHEAMNRFGVDKPDMRFGMELTDLSETFKTSAFKVFQATVAGGGVIKAINAKGLADMTQGELKALEDIAKSLGAKGLAFIKCEGGEWKSPIVKFFSDAEKAALTAQLGIEDGDMVFFAAAPWEKACAILGRVRLEAAQLLVKRGKLTIRADDWKFLWVVEFPQGARPALRSRAERHGARRRLDPHPPAGGAGDGVQGRAQDPGRRGREPLRLHAQCLQIRRASARRHRLRPRPHVRPALRHYEHPRRDRLPQDPEGAGPHGPVAHAGDGQAAQGIAHRGGGSGDARGRLRLDDELIRALKTPQRQGKPAELTPAGFYMSAHQWLRLI